MEFRIAPGWRIFIYLASLFFFGLGVWMFYQLLFSPESGEFWTNILVFILAVISILFSLYTPLKIFREKLSVQKDRLIYHSAFTSKTIFKDNIEGFRIDESYYRIVTKSKKDFKISLYIESEDQFIDYLYDNFDDLTISDQSKEASFILENVEFGVDKIQREKTFDRSRNIVKTLNICMVTLFILVIAFPHPWDVMVLLNLSILPIAIFLTIKYKGIVQLDGKKNSTLPHVSYLVLFPVLAVLMRIFYDMEILSYRNLWIPAFSLTSLISLFVFFKTGQLKFGNHIEQISFGAFVVFFFLYSMCLILTFNFIFDVSEPKYFDVEVLDKRESDSAYYLQLESDWHPLIRDEIDGTVSAEFYRKIVSGDIINVEFRHGALDIPWFQILENSFERRGERNYKFSIPDTLEY